MDEKAVLIVSAIVAPLVSALGLVLQYKKDRKAAMERKKLEDAEARKLEAEAEKIRVEAKALDTKTNMEVINFYINMVDTLRKEVDILIALSERNKREIEDLKKDKDILSELNAKLSEEVSLLIAEVKKLKINQETTNGTTN